MNDTKLSGFAQNIAMIPLLLDELQACYVRVAASLVDMQLVTGLDFADAIASQKDLAEQVGKSSTFYREEYTEAVPECDEIRAFLRENKLMIGLLPRE